MKAVAEIYGCAGDILWFAAKTIAAVAVIAAFATAMSPDKTAYKPVTITVIV